MGLGSRTVEAEGISWTLELLLKLYQYTCHPVSRPKSGPVRIQSKWQVYGSIWLLKYALPPHLPVPYNAIYKLTSPAQPAVVAPVASSQALRSWRRYRAP